ncbi:unnamed protein product, partial [Aureobasidium vineae]
EHYYKPSSNFFYYHYCGHSTRTSQSSGASKNPRHGCINGIKISTCKMCAGHVLRSKAACTACKGTGFTGARCTPCAIGAIFALRTLIKEVALDVVAGDGKRAVNLEKPASATSGTLRRKQMPEAEDSKAKETNDENGPDEEAETSEGGQRLIENWRARK